MIRKHTRFKVAAFNGPNRYTGDMPVFMRMHMLFTDEMADLREQILCQAILDAGLSASVADRWLKVDQRFRPVIVKKVSRRRALACAGQESVTAEKPLRPES